MIIKNAKLNWAAITRVNDMSGKYQVDMILPLEEARPYMEILDKAWEDHKGTFKGKPQSLGYTLVEDENGVETGEVKFKATQAPQSADGQYTFEVKVYDSKAREIAKDNIPSIGNGTIGNVDVQVYPYVYKTNKGIKLSLKAIQIIKLEEYNQGSSFDEVEDGFDAEPENGFQPEI